MNKLVLAITIAFVLAVFPFAATSIAGDSITLKIATLSPEGTHLMTVLKQATEEVARKTEGRVKFRIYPGGVMGNDTRILQKMRVGQIHGSTFTAGGISQMYSNYQILSLPMLFRNYAEVDAVRPFVAPIITQALEDNGYISFGVFEAGFIYMLSNYELKKPDDMKGHKVWVPEGDPIGRAVFEAANVPPVPLPLPDVLTGLQTGLLDTTASSPIGAVVLQWYTKVKYITHYPLLYGYGTLALSKKAWGKISEQDKPIVRACFGKMLLMANENTRIENTKAMATLKKQGLIFTELDEESVNLMQAIADKAIVNLISDGEFDKAMLAKIRATVAKVREGN
jgi:TRAP-type C4-dicarboxylate transport system substrate-binding protein